MPVIKVQDVTKKFGGREALRNLTFEVKDKELFTIVGYPGAGKTTLLRIIAGLEKPDGGEIYVDGQPVSNIYPGHRDIAMMFQNLALYPDKTVFDNVAFPLKIKKTSKEETKKRVLEIAEILHIEYLLDRRPATLSGGERQRVALGRALIRRPKLFLLDEPLTNLDALLRVDMRVELRRLQKELGQTIIVTTPDQLEAMSMSDRIAVLKEGQLEQVDTPDEIYGSPKSRFVAGFIGSPPMNFLGCSFVEGDGEAYLDLGPLKLNVSKYRSQIKKQATTSELTLGFRPEDIKIKTEKTSKEDLETTAYLVELLGSKNILHVGFADEVVKIIVPPNFTVDYGSKVWVELNPEKIYIFDGKTEKTIM